MLTQKSASQINNTAAARAIFEDYQHQCGQMHITAEGMDTHEANMRELMLAKAAAAERLVEIHRATTTIATGGTQGGQTFVGNLRQVGDATGGAGVPSIPALGP